MSTNHRFGNDHKPDETPRTIDMGAIKLTMTPCITGRGNNYPTYDLTVRLNWKQMHALRDGLAGRPNSDNNDLRALLDGALVAVRAPIEV